MHGRTSSPTAAPAAGNGRYRVSSLRLPLCACGAAKPCIQLADDRHEQLWAGRCEGCRDADLARLAIKHDRRIVANQLVMILDSAGAPMSEGPDVSIARPGGTGPTVRPGGSPHTTASSPPGRDSVTDTGVVQ